MNKPYGISNIGNSCYFNAALQLCKIICNNILDHTNFKNPNDEYLLNLKNFYDNPFDTNNLKSIYNMTCSNLKYRQGSQQDSCEVVQLITDKIKDNIVDKSNIVVKFNKLIKCDICSQYKICNNQNESMFISQSLIISNSNYIDFNNFISNVLKKESIQGYNFKCDCINPSIDIQVVLTDLPKFLVIKVGRCDNNLRKINKRLELANSFEITTPMDLKSRCENIEDYDVKHNYILYGMILHYGSMLNSGHYVTYIRQNNRWFLCDDSNVVEINDFNINDQNIQNNSCVLLYIKI